MSNHLRSHWSQVSKIGSRIDWAAAGAIEGHLEMEAQPRAKARLSEALATGQFLKPEQLKRLFGEEALEATMLVVVGCRVACYVYQGLPVGRWVLVGRLLVAYFGWLNLAVKLKYIVTCWVSFILRNACERVRQVTFGRFGPLYE